MAHGPHRVRDAVIQKVPADRALAGRSCVVCRYGDVIKAELQHGAGGRRVAGV